MSQKQNNWHRRFFTNFYLPYLHKENITEIQKEINFICNILQLPKKAKILDLACGLGRHAIELAKCGFKVTGLDFNKQFLETARKKAKKGGLVVKFIQSDMRSLPFQNEFDAVICMYTSFGYFNKKDNTKVLRNIARSLKKGGLLLLDLPSKEWVLNKLPRKTWQKIRNEYILEERSFDKKRGFFKDEITVLSPNAKPKDVCTFLYLYDPKEIKSKLNKQGLKVFRIFGDYDKKVSFDPSKFPRMIILAKKSSQ